MPPFKIEDMARRLDIDPSKIERYAQKGLIIFRQSGNGRIAGGPVELARLRFIVKAEELGYSIDNINRLVGHAYSVLRTDDPLDSSRAFAREVFKKLEAGLDEQDPLEQLNTRCDLRLLGDYLAELETCAKPGSGPAAAKAEKPSAIRKKGSFPAATDSAATPEDAKKDEKTPPLKQPRKGRIGLKLGAALLIVAAVGAGFLYARRQHKAEFPGPGSEIAQTETSGPAPDISVAESEQAFPVPPIEPEAENGKAAAPENAKTEAPPEPDPAIERPVETGTAESAAAADQKPDAEDLLLPEPEPVGIKPLPPLALPEPVRQADSETKPASKTPPAEKKPAARQAEAKSPAEAVKISNFTLLYSPSEKKYTARFNIVKAPGSRQERVRGYTFVLLETKSGDTIALPRVKLVGGRPARHSKGRFFSIARMKIQESSGKIDIPADSIKSATVLVYSATGSLIGSGRFSGRVTVTAPRQETAEPEAPPAAEPPRPQPARKEKPPRPAAGPKPASNEKSLKEALQWEATSYDLVRRGEYEKAITAASRAISLAPERVNPYINRSLAYIETEMYAKAIRDCDTVLAMDPENALAYNNRGLAFHRAGKLEQARADYKKACELGLELGCVNLADLEKEERINSLLEASRKAFMSKDWTAVIKYTTEVIGLDPANSVAYTNRSAAYAEKGQLKKALDDSMQALRLAPSFALAYNNRGYVYELMGETKKAAADYLKSCSLGFDLGCENLARLEKKP